MSPRLAFTMGDPAGIGPELCLKLLARPDLEVRPPVIGDAAWLARTARDLGLTSRVRTLDAPEASRPEPGVVEVLQVGKLPENLALGRVQAEAGAAAYAYIRQGIDWCLEGALQGLVTAPIHKEALAAAGVPFPGHTEMLEHHAGVPATAMMLATPVLRVVLVTIHVALRKAIDLLDVERELRAIRFAALGGRAFGIAKPRIAVAGLNPHAGEGGLFGDEEARILAPAIARARAEGLDVTGPWPGDTVFLQAREGRFDVVVAQYHDQGLIPIKYLGLAEGVNVTLGLPFVRTSPDHGTAFDIAGTGRADPASLQAALDTARALLASTSTKVG
ncbi:MAG: 4-hydroxythreonine-4-phosphate dehydrogenase PdxA [Pseudomonadota bacterium]